MERGKTKRVAKNRQFSSFSKLFPSPFSQKTKRWKQRVLEAVHLGAVSQNRRFTQLFEAAFCFQGVEGSQFTERKKRR